MVGLQSLGASPELASTANSSRGRPDGVCQRRLCFVVYDRSKKNKKTNLKVASLVVRSDRERIKLLARVTHASLMAGSAVSICVTCTTIKPMNIRPEPWPK